MDTLGEFDGDADIRSSCGSSSSAFRFLPAELLKEYDTIPTY